jgi:hypothetical protein
MLGRGIVRGSIGSGESKNISIYLVDWEGGLTMRPTTMVTGIEIWRF